MIFRTRRDGSKAAFRQRVPIEAGDLAPNLGREDAIVKFNNGVHGIPKRSRIGRELFYVAEVPIYDRLFKIPKTVGIPGRARGRLVVVLFEETETPDCDAGESLEGGAGACSGIDFEKSKPAARDNRDEHGIGSGASLRSTSTSNLRFFGDMLRH